ncbi:dTDP-4-dehydrorhamnose reductase [Sphingomonas sp. PAMC 26605]|uniref:dTDP-4-dehydrorhamnose reductase n=1 Tax=Sphingomonas sp. PAMC 26605 TaxID=1112214 RepID=UPI00026CA729|nr:dTDP-4-dehydrorhamnose reductase [Sphingomonas sp. PAMC 26605]
MKALITGADGQVGTALRRAAPDRVEVIAVDRSTLDITDRAAVEAMVARVRPDIIINAAAYTAVDRAESDTALAKAVNATAVGHLAAAARAAGARLIQVSTDYVFDGRAAVPYSPAAATAPLSVYGRTKRAGEVLAGEDALIVRTARVYGPTGNNFVRTMLRLMAERGEVRVVADQIGTPTYVPGLAAALWALAGQGATGIFHHTDSGSASWYDFAVAIAEEARILGLLVDDVTVTPIATTQFPTPAGRPLYSVLDTSATTARLGVAPHWRSNLRIVLNALLHNG